MWSRERQSRILDFLNRDGKVETHGLAAALDVSRETIRRDLMEMEAGGLLARAHGGALPPRRDVAPEPPLAARRGTHAAAKDAIARTAAALVPAGATLFVDAGSTTLAFARALLGRDDLRIITNSVDIALLGLADVLLLGGRMQRDMPATEGELTLAEIDRFQADLAVFSPVALHPERGAMSYALHEAEIARRMMARSDANIVLCHAEKLGAISRVTLCPPDSIDAVVTNAAHMPALPRAAVHLAA